MDTFQKITSAGYVDTFQAGYVDTSLLTHLRNQSKLYSMNSFLPTYYSQYIVLIEIFHWLGWHLAYSLIKLFHWQSEALHWQAAQELLLWKCWVCAQSQ